MQALNTYFRWAEHGLSRSRSSLAKRNESKSSGETDVDQYAANWGHASVDIVLHLTADLKMLATLLRDELKPAVLGLLADIPSDMRAVVK